MAVKKYLPEIKYHPKNKEFYCYWYRVRKYLGRTLEAAEKRRLQLVAEAAVNALAEPSVRGISITVSQLCLEFLAAHHDFGNTKNYKIISQHLVDLYADLPVNAFGPLELQAVRAKIVTGRSQRKSTLGQPVSRAYVNKLINLARRIFKWGVSRTYYPPENLIALRCVEALQLGHSDGTVERPVVEAVAEDVIEATLPHLPPTLADMVRVQCLTGMRPKELCEMRLSEIDASDPECWIYAKRDHKTAWRGKSKIVPLGPRAIAILSKYVEWAKGYTNDFLFSPIRSENQRLKELRLRRKTKVQPSQVCRKKPQPKRVLRECYTAAAYARRISLICKKHGIPHWFPYQIRHLVAETAQAQHGSIEHVCALLGDDVESAKIYAQRNLTLAKKLAKERG